MLNLVAAMIGGATVAAGSYSYQKLRVALNPGDGRSLGEPQAVTEFRVLVAEFRQAASTVYRDTIRPKARQVTIVVRDEARCVGMAIYEEVQAATRAAAIELDPIRTVVAEEWEAFTEAAAQEVGVLADSAHAVKDSVETAAAATGRALGASPVSRSDSGESVPSSEGEWQHIKQAAGTQLNILDERYQRFFAIRIDPLLGRSRQLEMQQALSGETLLLDPAERYANRRLGLGLTALSLSLMGTFVLTPLMPLAIFVGLAASSAKYPHAYRQWKETKRIGAIHLVCVYSLYLWLGGYASIGALGAVLYGVMLKAKAVAEDQSRGNLISMFQLQPDKVWVLADGIEVEIPFDDVRIGDTLVLRAGQVAPVDGTIIEGEATVDQHMLTGEAQPVERRAGDAVLAATLLISGRVHVAVEKTSAETAAGKIAEVLNRTIKNTKPVSLSAVQAADKLALPTLALSAISFPFIGTAGAVSLMGANTTTASYMSSYLATLTFLNLAARIGVLVKDAHALEQLAGANTIVFDKTGTLTLEQPRVAQIHTLNGATPERVLQLAAAAEARQTHPIARAILDLAAERDVPLPVIDQAHYEVGLGLKVRLVEPSGSGQSINGSSNQPLIRVGSGRFMTMEGIALQDRIHTLTEACHEQGHSLVMVALDREVIGCIELMPTVRPEAHDIVQGLRRRGLDLRIISGDQEGPTRKLANDLGMNSYFANVLPEGKADLIAKLQEEGRKVCYIGDGINDALAMRQAQVSISLLGATSVATDTARIVLMDGNLDKLLNLFELADKFERNLKLNIRFTSGVSVVAVSGILFAGFTVLATEIFYSAALCGGLAISLRPMLASRGQKDNSLRA